MKQSLLDMPRNKEHVSHFALCCCPSPFTETSAVEPDNATTLTPKKHNFVLPSATLLLITYRTETNLNVILTLVSRHSNKRVAKRLSTQNLVYFSKKKIKINMKVSYGSDVSES